MQRVQKAVAKHERARGYKNRLPLLIAQWKAQARDLTSMKDSFYGPSSRELELEKMVCNLSSQLEFKLEFNAEGAKNRERWLKSEVTELTRRKGVPEEPSGESHTAAGGTCGSYLPEWRTGTRRRPDGERAGQE